ncbi:Wzz/FepE/Etk N-terminal domain-containing protein [Devosia sp. Naph2]|uniref:Wzz/FepE/Etk N-terminal domain-containing protein n=1 Tax=Devosia polycyclovorans TaxID=3345148 RepID=UPI0035D0C4B9
MLERTKSQATLTAPSDVRLIDLEHLQGILLRQARIILLCLGLGLLVGVIIVITAPRTYQAASQIVIEGQVDKLAPEPRSGGGRLDMEGQILNQMEVIGSSRLARIVAEKEQLTTDQVFLNPPPTGMETARAFVGDAIGRVLGRPPVPREVLTEAPLELVVDALRGGVQVQRVGRSSVIWLGYQSHDAQLAYRIVNAYTAAFVRDQLNADLEVTREAADWLGERLIELGNSQLEAALEVDEFRRASGLTVAADVEFTNRRLQLLTDQISEAKTKATDLEVLVARLKQVDLEDAHQVVATAGLLSAENSAGNEAVAVLRDTFAHAERRIVEISERFGPGHPQIALLRQEQRAAAMQLAGRLEAQLDRYVSELQVAQSRVDLLDAQVEEEGRAATETNQALTQLLKLEERSETLNSIYRAYLSRYEETIQEQSFPIPAARVISDASFPRSATGPRTLFTLAGGLVFGGFLGLALSALNEMRERSFRLGSQVTRETGLRFLGYMSAMPTPSGDRSVQARKVQQDIRKQITSRRSNLPTTLLTETLKAAKVAALSRRVADKGVVVGVVSALPGEGKTSFAIALAELAVTDGYVTLLADGDVRRASASTLLAPKHQLGLEDIAQGLPWQHALFKDPLGFDVVSARSSSTPALNGSDIGSPHMQRLLDEAREAYDMVIIDLPPIGAMVDAVSIQPWTDGFILVTEWGKTPRRVVKAVIEREPQIAEDIIGVVLNRVRIEKLQRYSNPGDTERFVVQYPDYLRTPDPVA